MIKNLDSNTKKDKWIEVKTFNEGIELIKTNPKKYFYMFERTALKYEVRSQNLKQYLPPSFKDSNFNLDMHAIAMNNEFKYKLQLNLM